MEPYRYRALGFLDEESCFGCVEEFLGGGVGWWWVCGRDVWVGGLEEGEFGDYTVLLIVRNCERRSTVGKY